MIYYQHDQDIATKVCLRECRACRIAELEAQRDRLAMLLKRSKDRMYQHSNHWDRTGHHGVGCEECKTDAIYRNKIDAALAELEGTDE